MPRKYPNIAAPLRIVVPEKTHNLIPMVKSCIIIDTDPG